MGLSLLLTVGAGWWASDAWQRDLYSAFLLAHLEPDELLDRDTGLVQDLLDGLFLLADEGLLGGAR